jgi:hypothetical protein
VSVAASPPSASMAATMMPPQHHRQVGHSAQDNAALGGAAPLPTSAAPPLPQQATQADNNNNGSNALSWREGQPLVYPEQDHEPVVRHAAGGVSRAREGQHFLALPNPLAAAVGNGVQQQQHLSSVAHTAHELAQPRTAPPPPPLPQPTTRQPLPLPQARPLHQGLKMFAFSCAHPLHVTSGAYS